MNSPNRRPTPRLFLASAPDVEEGERVKDLRAEAIELVRQKNYDRALDVLVVLRALVPDDRAISDSIEQIKGLLVARFAQQLGGLDAIAPPIPNGAARTHEMIVVARLLDGTATVDDVCRTSPFGPLQTLKILHALYRTALSKTHDYVELGEDLAPRAATRSSPPVAAPMIQPPAPQPSKGSSPADEPAFDFNATFQRGVSAYVQRRYDDALEAFERCLRERPLDRQVDTMLNRVRAEQRRSS